MLASTDDDLLHLLGSTTNTRIAILENLRRTKNDRHANDEKCFENDHLRNVAPTHVPTPQRGLLTTPHFLLDACEPHFAFAITWVRHLSFAGGSLLLNRSYRNDKKCMETEWRFATQSQRHWRVTQHENSTTTAEKRSNKNTDTKNNGTELPNSHHGCQKIKTRDLVMSQCRTLRTKTRSICMYINQNGFECITEMSSTDDALRKPHLPSHTSRNEMSTETYEVVRFVPSPIFKTNAHVHM